MLLKLENRTSNPNLTSICVNAVVSNPVDNDVSTVIGFGLTPRGAPDCEMCTDLNDGDTVDSVMLCTGVPGGGKDICEGDSGGPISDRDGTQVALVSWGFGCVR
jgi:secreted trypsin-like serine protease